MQGGLRNEQFDAQTHSKDTQKGVQCSYRKEGQQGRLINRGGANLRILPFVGMTNYRVGLTTAIPLQTIYNPLILSVNINL